MLGSAQPWRMLVFGASGAVGGAICSRGVSNGWDVVGTSRSPRAAPAVRADIQWVAYDPFAQRQWGDSQMSAQTPFDAVCWAQGANLSDSVYDFDEQRHLELYRANCLFVLKSMAALATSGLLAKSGARLCMVSSIWQERTRPNKLSYAMTKAALGGLVRAASVDMARNGHLVNAVLPGVLDTPMTAVNLTPDQLNFIKGATPFGRLPDLQSVAELSAFFCSAANTSVTGQSIAVDLGFSNACLL